MWNLVADPLCKILRCWVEVDNLIEKLVVELVLDHLLDDGEVHDHAVPV